MENSFFIMDMRIFHDRLSCDEQRALCVTPHFLRSIRRPFRVRAFNIVIEDSFSDSKEINHFFARAAAARSAFDRCGENESLRTSPPLNWSVRFFKKWGYLGLPCRTQPVGAVNIDRRLWSVHRTNALQICVAVISIPRSREGANDPEIDRVEILDLAG